jgi:uncharacterized protein YbaR (Trm112 family)
MEPDPKLLEILVCPVTKGPLIYDRERQELVSRLAGLAYPIRNGVPIMLPGEARELSEAERDREMKRMSARPGQWNCGSIPARRRSPSHSIPASASRWRPNICASNRPAPKCRATARREADRARQAACEDRGARTGRQLCRAHPLRRRPRHGIVQLGLSARTRHRITKPNGRLI